MADFTSPEATATRAALLGFPSVESLIPNAPVTYLDPREFLGAADYVDDDLVRVYRGEGAWQDTELGQRLRARQDPTLRHWTLDRPTAVGYSGGFNQAARRLSGGPLGPFYEGVLPISEAARGYETDPLKIDQRQIRVPAESSDLIKAGRGGEATVQEVAKSVAALEDPKVNPLLKAGRGFLKGLGRVVPGLNVAGGALAAYEHEQKGQDVRKWLAAASTAPYGLGIPPFIGEQAGNLGEWMMSPLADVPDYVDPKEIPAYIGNPETWASEEELPFILNPENTLLPEQPFVRDSLGYNVRDETARLAALASGRLGEYGDFDISPEVQSQSAQALIRSFTENPEVASLVSREGDRRAAVEEALETYLPSAMGIYDDPAQFQEPLTEARKGIMDLIGMPEYGPTPPYDEGWSQRRMLEEPVARSPGEEYVTHRQEIADLKNVEHDYTSDLANWNRSQQGTSDDSDVAEAKYNVMKHLNLIFGYEDIVQAGPSKRVSARTGIEDRLEPDVSAGGYTRQAAWHPFILEQSDYLRDEATAVLDSPSTIQKALDNLSGQDQRVKVMDTLTDMANNDTFRTLREEGVSKEDAYKSGDVVWDQRELRDLAQELINNERDPETITVENVKEEAKKASDKRTDVREEARKPKKKEEEESVADVEDFSAIRDRAAEKAAQRDRDVQEKADERNRKAEKAADERNRRAEKAAADRESAARSKATEKAAKASRKAEAKREAATKKEAQKQRDKLDSASKKALQNHMAWMATQSERLEKEKKLRQKQGYGSGDMWT